jgi:glycosyltransferase involved in cell wall biosynthesis
MDKIAIVHEWFVNYMGSEKCVESFVNIWNDAEVFALVDYLDKEKREKILKGKNVNTSFLQKLPFSKTKYRSYLPLFPLAIEQLDISGYDVILSSSHAVAKGVLTNANQLHICYCHTPIRYAWDLYFQYLKDSNLTSGIKSWIAKYFLHKIRMWDYTTANRVDYFIANSKYIARRIKKIYGKYADVIYPPVDIDKFAYTGEKDNYYLAVARFVPYKKIDLVVSAFSKMPDKKLIVIGDGPDTNKIKSIAGKNVELIGYQETETLKTYMQKAKAFVFAAEEDFGITTVEAQASGTPVIGFNRGGTSEIVVDNETGLLFNEQTVTSIIESVNKFELLEDKFDAGKISKHAEQFSRSNFENSITEFVTGKYNGFKNGS